MKQRHILYILLVSALLFGTLSYAETVESISYNPSRMGVFTYLKVQDEAVLRGGLTTPNLNINTTKATVQAANKIQTGVVTVSDLVEFTNAELSDSVTHDNYVYSNTPSNVAGTVNMNGGNAVVEEDSFINSLAHVGRVKLKALGTIYTPGVVIDGSYSNVPFVNGYGKGFKLGNYDIPLPTQLADGDTYEYVWQEMQFKDKKATVLTLQKEGASGCTSDEDVVDRCGHSNGTWDDNNCTCICPQGTYWDTTQDWCEPVCKHDYTWEDCVRGGQDPNSVPGTWNDSTCSCTCPADTEFVEGHGCIGNSCAGMEYEISGCEHSYGTWLYDTCECACPTRRGGHWDSSTAECKCTSYPEAISRCKAEGSWPEVRYRQVPGVWDTDHCACRCLSGSKRYGSYVNKDERCFLEDGVSQDDFNNDHGGGPLKPADWDMDWENIPDDERENMFEDWADEEHDYENDIHEDDYDYDYW